ncbi:MAG: NAD(P)H-dependent oxidoreductase [Taibaiella sp.]|nr:NAD(P)H-dependent oxidoreductase [Taibaiella sp.]
MITIISGTNRPGSMSLKTAVIYYNKLRAAGENVSVLSLEGKQVWERAASMVATEAEFLIPAEKFIFILPEYNASFPGIVKSMMDNSDIKKCWWYKKAMLVGISDGRAGNLRGIEHMTSILHYLKINVLYNKVLLSTIKDEISQEGVLLKPATEALIDQQIENLIKF